MKGLCRPSKLNKVITHLDDLQAKIVFLQSHNLFAPYFLVEQGESLSLFINIFILISQMCWLTVMADTS